MEELEAPKPGNVSFASAGHGMTADDFVASARCTADVLGTPGSFAGRAGARKPSRATRAATGCNTNLVNRAAVRSARTGGARCGSGSSVAGRARPGSGGRDGRGHGASVCGDSPGRAGGARRERASRCPKLPAAAPVLAVMREAEHRDRVARQYARCFEDVFDLRTRGAREGVGRGGRGRRRWWRSTSRFSHGLRTLTYSVNSVASPRSGFGSKLCGSSGVSMRRKSSESEFREPDEVRSQSEEPAHQSRYERRS